MSNFSTFFPAGGGGKGAGINSYAPFKVAATGNPIGYNATTGLYTNPVDESVWLKTGNTLGTSSIEYPNATGGSVQVPSRQSAVAYGPSGPVVGASGNLQGITYDTVNNSYWVVTTSPDLITEYSVSFVATGNSFTPTFSGTVYPRNIAYDGNSDTLWLQNLSPGVCHEFTKAGVATGRTISITSANGGITWDVDNGTLWLGNFVSGQYTGLRQYAADNSGEIGSPVNLGTNSYGSKPRITYISSSQTFWVTGNSQPIREYTKLGVATGTVVSPGFASPTDLSNNDQGGFTQATSTNGPLYAYNNVYEVGDATARTDASGSAQPLFIKLK